MTISLPVFLAVLGCLLMLIQHLRTRWTHARKAREWNCASIPRYPADILGLSTLRESLQADREGLIPLLLQRRVETVSARENRPVTTFGIRQMGRENIFTCDPANVQALLATKFRDFELGPTRRHTLLPLLGVGIFTSDGDTWSRSRALLRPQFTRDQISDLDLEERHVQQAMLAMPVDASTRWTPAINIQDIFFRLTMDSATEFLFGESVQSQAEALRNGGNLPPDNFQTYFDRGQWYAAQRARFEKLYWLVDNSESKLVVRQVHRYVDRLVADALSPSPATADAVEPPRHPQYIFLHALIATTKDPIELRAQLLNVLLAGRDTTASLLSWSILMLARHPLIFTDLRTAIISDFGPYSPGNHRNRITFSSLKACRTLQHFLNEVLRLYPVVPVNRRVACKDTFLPRGGGADGSLPVYVRAGQAVVYSPFVTQRLREVWGGDAEVFYPLRWEKSIHTSSSTSSTSSGSGSRAGAGAGAGAGWEYYPFNGGPRICIGQQFALTETAYVVVRLLQRFDVIEDVFPGREVRYGVSLTSAPVDGVTVRMHEA